MEFPLKMDLIGLSVSRSWSCKVFQDNFNLLSCISLIFSFASQLLSCIFADLSSSFFLKSSSTDLVFW
mgnify:CR=1 FL=1